jgi:hypothetical protein
MLDQSKSRNQKLRIYTIAVVLALISVCSNVTGQETLAQALTLQESIDIALSNNLSTQRRNYATSCLLLSGQNLVHFAINTHLVRNLKRIECDLP